MIKCNLAVLLAERGLKMADVINDTSLSKTAVRSLYYNESKGIQFETLETICDYLEVEPGEVLKKFQFEYVIINKKINEEEFTIDYEVNFKLDDKELIDFVQVAISSSDIYELFEEDDGPQDIDIDILYTKKLKQSMLSQITEFETDKLDDFFIDEFISTFDLEEHHISLISINWGQ